MLTDIERSMTANTTGQTPVILWEQFASFSSEREFQRAIEERARVLGLKVTWLVSGHIADFVPGRGRGLRFTWEPLSVR